MIDHDNPAQVSPSQAPVTATAGQPADAEIGAAPPARGKGSPLARKNLPLALKNSPLALKNWRVRWRLLALVAIPTATAIALGGMRIETSIHSAGSFQRIEQLAVLGGDVTSVAQALENERDLTAGFIAAGRPAAAQATLRRQYAVTDSLAAAVRSRGAGIGHRFPAGTREPLATVLARMGDLQGLRAAAAGSKTPALPVITDYSQVIGTLFALNDDIAQGGASQAPSGSVRTLGLLSRIKDQASQQRAILYAAFFAGRLSPDELEALTSAQGQEASDLATFMSSATAGERQRYSDAVAGGPGDEAQQIEQQAITLGRSGAPLLARTRNTAAASRQWYRAMSSTIGQLRTVERQAVTSIIAQSQALRRGATRSALVTGVVVLLVLIFVVLLTAVIARSMVRPLRRLRAGALDVAGVRLPAKVRELGETGGDGETLEVQPIDVTSTDEVGEVARAFDQVHSEALRLAANEAMLRGNINAMFVSLSRRSQSLVERQIKLIDELERGEQDAERLANLFRMDHLATRMRRNSENLLVLAGHEAIRRWGKPVTLVDVLRAAVSEIEQYERVTLNIQPGTSVAGNAVNDVVHLLAELLENATSFSPGDTAVKVAGHPLNSGGVLLDITDQGVGMGTEEMAHANWRLENPPVVDVAVSRRMGLFVVARLAARHGIRVRLRQPELGGLTALIWLPDTLISEESTALGPGLRRFGSLEPAQAADARSRPARPVIVSPPALPSHHRRGLPASDSRQLRELRPRPVRPVGHERVRDAATEPPPAPDVRPLPQQPIRAIIPVVVPTRVSHGPDARLPIYDSLESDWFHRRRQPEHDKPAGARRGPAMGPPWTSAGDEGWHAARDAAAPSAGGLTAAGLPRRIPQANSVPGAAATRGPASATPALSAEGARNRMASFQQGVRRARAAIRTDDTPGG